MSESGISFLVFEQDPFVLEDIRDTLSAYCADTKVSIFNELQELSEAIRAEARRTICILSTSHNHDVSSISSRIANDSLGEVVLITPQAVAPGAADDGRFVYVPKPFKSEMLIEAIRTALSRPPSSR